MGVGGAVVIWLLAVLGIVVEADTVTVEDWGVEYGIYELDIGAKSDGVDLYGLGW